ncbi:MAG: glutamate--cysteine ligase [Gammaproteobacteria bacterium]|nr:MAG: glutamate--cysteine ligase [Gammaproteobacteria bacterium]
MNSIIEQRVANLLTGDIRQVLQGRQVGLEKESLRVAVDGGIAQTPHPLALGSALTHPSITTDYSEALLELVTPPFHHFCDTLQFLDDTQRFVYSQLEDEILWATSMPCVVEGDASIPIAQYGTSNAAKMKTAYRRGLGHRYGRMMQAIAGVHFNYSYPQEFWHLYQSELGDTSDRQTFISESYIDMVRNLQRFGWLVPYLFGASPAICASFLGAAPTSLEKWQKYSYYAPYATSLRVGDIGYQNSKEGEAGIRVNYNSLRDYIDSLAWAISTPYPEYEKIPLINGGEWQQLNANILQIENEYYSSVRPKQIPQGEEKPTLALAKRGVAYLEIRSLDVNAYEPLGISEHQMRFLESFLLFSLLAPSEPYDDAELSEIKHNINAVAERGRDPALRLQRKGETVLLRDWANEIFEQMSAACDLLDRGAELPAYSEALQRQHAKIADPDLTPSARMLSDMAENREEFYHFALRMSQQHQQRFAERPLEAEKLAVFEETARASIEKQREIEAADDVSFETFMQNYFAQT